MSVLAKHTECIIQMLIDAVIIAIITASIHIKERREKGWSESTPHVT
jgi:hypothetical protein